MNLQVLSLSGTPAERQQAPRVLNLIKAGRHTMLVVLLFGADLIWRVETMLIRRW